MLPVLLHLLLAYLTRQSHNKKGNYLRSKVLQTMKRVRQLNKQKKNKKIFYGASRAIRSTPQPPYIPYSFAWQII
jgi:hypothetical protein